MSHALRRQIPRNDGACAVTFLAQWLINYTRLRGLSLSLPLFSLSFSSTTTIKSDNKKTCFFLFATLSRALSIMRTNSLVSHTSQLKNSDRTLRNKCKKSFSIRIDLKLNVITGLFYWICENVMIWTFADCNFIKVTILPRALNKHIGYYYNIYRVQTTQYQRDIKI